MWYLLFFTISLLPALLHATTLTSVVVALTGVIDSFVKAGVAVALLIFIWGIVKVVIAMNSGGASNDSITKGRQHMFWGLVGLFVIVSVWGLVALLGTLFGVSNPPSSYNTPTAQLGESDED